MKLAKLAGNYAVWIIPNHTLINYYFLLFITKAWTSCSPV